MDFMIGFLKWTVVASGTEYWSTPNNNFCFFFLSHSIVHIGQAARANILPTLLLKCGKRKASRTPILVNSPNSARINRSNFWTTQPLRRWYCDLTRTTLGIACDGARQVSAVAHTDSGSRWCPECIKRANAWTLAAR
jgi:hypothetical protein